MATPEETAILKGAGFRLLQVNEPPGDWWLPAGGDQTMTTQEALTDVLQSRQFLQAVIPASLPPALPKPGIRSTEFWAVAGIVIPLLTVAVEAMREPTAALPPPWNAVVGVGLAGVSAALVGAYALVRQRAKSVRQS